ncbi:MAG TPA: hypothetical protein DCQ06_04055 [Myxococcales bacterium]|nr:hypothetical protein [Myxococcales bacterium]
MTTMPTEALMRKRRRPQLPVTSRSMALFRLGETCNNHCPMCSNSGRPEAFLIKEKELFARVDRLVSWGFQRVILTGGEPTIHPSFLKVASALRAKNIAFDINTHGRSFAKKGLAETCVGFGLERAIVSLHSHKEQPSCAMSGFSARAHEDTLRGIDALIEAGVAVSINLVMSTHNLDHLTEFVHYCAERFGTETAIKLCFPYTGGKGGDWQAIQLRYTEVQQPLREAIARGQQLGVHILTESVPNCIHGDAESSDTSRSGFGETHYLEDVHGLEIFPMRYIEAQLKVWPHRCRQCPALSRCPGVQEAYAKAYGVEEFSPFAIEH